MTTEGEERSSNKLLVGILSGLILVIVGLVIGIVVVNNTPKIIVLENEGEIVNGILDAMIPMTVEEAEDYLDDQLVEYAGTSVVQKIKIMKVNVFVNDGFFNDAIVVANDIDEKDLDTREKMDFFAAMAAAYDGVGNVEEYNYYSEKYMAVYTSIFGGGLGG